MINILKFIDFLRRNEVEFATGVPDTLLNDFCLGLESHWEKGKHILAANEGNAIALATGYHLATNTVPLVYMQNSGMGNAMNPLISLTDKCVYSIPLVLLIGWRGEPGAGDWPQHQRQGELTPTLLNDLDIPYKVLDEDEQGVLDAMSWAISQARAMSQPTALLVRKNVLALKEKAGFDGVSQIYTMSREQAIRELVCLAPENTIFVGSTGRISRELHAIRDILGHSHDQDFLNVGAMGHALSIAAGIAAAQPQRNIVCLDGDAAAIMHLGSMPVSANLALPNLLHVVLNNGAHESVGGQQSVGFEADLTDIAKASGYQTLDSFVTTPDELNQKIKKLLGSNYPAFLEVRIKKGMRNDMPVLRAELLEKKNNLMRHLSCKGNK